MATRRGKSRRRQAKARQEANRYDKIVGILGFRSLVEEARGQLLAAMPDKETGEDLAWAAPHKFGSAVILIMELCKLQPEDQAFVMNAVRFGFRRALQSHVTPQVRILVPVIPRRVAELSHWLYKLLWPRERSETWLDVRENGKPAGVLFSSPGELTSEPSSTASPAPATIIQGQGVLAVMAADRGPRIYMDVTSASK